MLKIKIHPIAAIWNRLNSLIIIKRIITTRSKIKFLWQLAISSQKKIAPPQKSKILIYDATNQDLLLDYLGYLRPEVLHVRGEEINLYCLIRSLFKSGRRFKAYVDTYIGAVDPSIVITLIDNNPGFYNVQARNPKIKTVLIQNGFRTAYDFDGYNQVTDAERKSWYIDYMLVFGNCVGKEYRKYIDGKTISIGSFKNNMAPYSPRKNIDQITYISQYNYERVNLGGQWFSHQMFCRQPDESVLGFMRRYAVQRGKRIVVALRYKNTDSRSIHERAHFKSILGSECTYIDSSSEFSSYERVDEAEVVVSIDSTLAYESLVRGNRTALFSIRSEILGIEGYTYGWPKRYPDIGPFWTNHVNENIYSEILDRLFNCSNEEWESMCQDSELSKIMKMDKENSIFLELIANELA